MIKYANVLDMRFVGRVLHNFTFHDNFVRFYYVHCLWRDVEEIMQITCPAYHVHPMTSKFALTDSYITLSIPEAGETAETPVKRYCNTGKVPIRTQKRPYPVKIIIFY